MTIRPAVWVVWNRYIEKAVHVASSDGAARAWVMAQGDDYVYFNIEEFEVDAADGV